MAMAKLLALVTLSTKSLEEWDYNFLIYLLAEQKDPTSGVKIDNKTLNEAFVTWLDKWYLNQWDCKFLKYLLAEQKDPTPEVKIDNDTLNKAIVNRDVERHQIRDC